MVGTRLIAVGLMVAATAFARAPHTAVAAPLAPGFSTPTPAGVFGNGFETDLRLDYTANNTIAYEGAPQSLSSTISTVQRSLDGGLTFKLVPGQASGASGGKNVACPAGGGDIELDTPNGHLMYSDLTLTTSAWPAPMTRERTSTPGPTAPA